MSEELTPGVCYNLNQCCDDERCYCHNLDEKEKEELFNEWKKNYGRYKNLGVI